MNTKVDKFMARATSWQEEMEMLRAIVLDCNLEEELKWGNPCYSLNGKNIVLIHAFKDYCAYLFFKGVLMADEHQLLIQQTANVQAARQIRFTSLSEIRQKEAILKNYIKNAIEIEEAGLKVEMKKTDEFEMCEEFATAIKKDHVLEDAFYKLTPGRQRAYLLHFSSAKQSKTRETRIAGSREMILEGKGLND